MTTVRDYKKAFAREVQHWPQADITFTNSIFASNASDIRALTNAVADIGGHFASAHKRIKF